MQTTEITLEPGQAVWEAVLERGCGLDVHQKTATACLLIGPLEEPAAGISTHLSYHHTRAPGTTRLASAEWLHSRGH